MTRTQDDANEVFQLMEPLEPRILLAAGPSSLEQYMLELINRARANPAAEAARFGIGLNEGVPPGDLIDTAVTRQPLAFNLDLIDAARDHSRWMLDHDIFDHDEPGGRTPPVRMVEAGYEFAPPPAGWGENIGWQSASSLSAASTPETVASLHEALFVDAGYAGRGHRVNMLYPAFQEIGIGAVAGIFTSYRVLMVTQDFAYRNRDPFITGVVYDDTLVTADSFYTPGEGLGGVKVEAVGPAGEQYPPTTTWSSGGYSLQVPDGVYSVTFSGGKLKHDYTFAGVVVNGKNVKQDFLVNLAPTGLDLTVLATPAGGRTIYARPGTDVTVPCSVRNAGKSEILDTFTVGLFQSPDVTVDESDTPVASYPVDGLDAGRTDRQSFVFAAPADAGTYYLSALADSADIVAESAEENNWGSTIKLIVGEPNLEGAFGTISLRETIVPGDRGTIRFTVTNTGQIPAAGAVDVKIYASTNAVGGDGDDVLLLTIGGANTTWVPGQSRTYIRTVNITDELAQGDFYLVAQIDSQDAVDESDEGDNVVISPGPRQLKWQFGNFDGRRRVRLTLHDAAGTKVTFSLAGAGWGEVSGGADLTDTIVHDTTTASALTIYTSAYRITLGGITVEGPIRSIHAEARLTGNVEVEGGIASLYLRDVDPADGTQATIDFHTNPALPVAADLRTTLRLGAVHDCSLTSDVPVRSLTATGWVDDAADNDVIDVPSLARLSIRKRSASARYGLDASAGQFQADLLVRGAVGTVTIAGSVDGADGSWDLGSLGTTTIRGMLTGCTIRLGQPVAPDYPRRLTLRRLTVTGGIVDSVIDSAGHVGTVTTSMMIDSDIFVALMDPEAFDRNGGQAGLPHPAADLAEPIDGVDAKLAGVTINGRATSAGGYSTINVRIVAPLLGTINLTNPLAANDPQQEWGLAGHSLSRYATRTGAIRYSWTPRSSDPLPTQPGGDFRVRLG